MQNLDQSATEPFCIDGYGHTYCVRCIPWHDTMRQDAYQRLRAEVFIKQLGWRIPVDPNGRERDRYDEETSVPISVYGVYGKNQHQEHLLGGVRLFFLQDWEQSMTMNEFAHMMPEPVLRQLRALPCQDFIEVTRFCVRRRQFLVNGDFSTELARDFTYAAVYLAAYRSQRFQAVGIADPHYLKIMQRAHFAFTELYAAPGGSLVVIDLPATIHRICAQGDEARARRMLSLCSDFA